MQQREPGIQWRRERELRDRARELRIWQTDAEKVLWQHLRAKKAGGYHFRRQFPIGEFIVDFCCFQEKLVVELDGDYHEEPEAKSYDEWRQIKLESAGWRVVRFRNEEVLSDPGEVRARVLNILGQS